MQLYKNTWIRRTTLIIVCLCILTALLTDYHTPTFTVKEEQPDFIIDAGHGLPDGGAQASDGTTEQQLNLEISLLLQENFVKNKFNSIMTRYDENGIYTTETTIRSKKVADIKRRIEIADKYPDALWISIHMNAFSSDLVHGCQVFYQQNDSLSQKLALAIQTEVNTKLQPDNPKKIKEIPKNVHLFKNIKNTPVLIECGFISNTADLKKLKDPTFQKELVDIIYNVISKERK